MSLQATALSFNLELIICTGLPLVDVQEANSSLESEKNVAVMSTIRFLFYYLFSGIGGSSWFDFGFFKFSLNQTKVIIDL